jgi:hypothetical protein
VAQFDYDTTVIYDFQGQSIRPDLRAGAGREFRCAAPFPTTAPVPPARYTDSVAVDLNGEIIQIRPFRRVLLIDGTARPNNGADNIDTLITGGNSGAPALANTGVPFAFSVDGSGLLERATEQRAVLLCRHLVRRTRSSVRPV